MGDKNRFRELAKLVSQEYPNRDLKIIDVAGGKGKLKAELYLLGYTNVTTMDKRKKNTTQRIGFSYKHFESAIEPAGWELILGMHPDEASEEIIDYCGKNRNCAYILCPCCIRPTISYFNGVDYQQWYNHLWSFSISRGIPTVARVLPITGRNWLLLGRSNETFRL